MDEQIFVLEVQAMERTLYRVSRSILSSQEECADAVQEALAKAWVKRETVQEEYFRAWLTRIVINECHNINRHKKRHVMMAELEVPAIGAPPDPDLRDAIAALPEKLRLPLLLHYMEGFPLREVANIIRIPVGTVKSRLQAARARLKAEMEVRG